MKQRLRTSICNEQLVDFFLGCRFTLLGQNLAHLGGGKHRNMYFVYLCQMILPRQQLRRTGALR
jgi:hypothetical protein